MWRDCELRPGPDRVRVSVSDTGFGLSQEQLDQLFQPFNRLGQDAGAEEGTGIGLVVAKRLTELMGGAIGVEISIGKGSVFWIELSAAPTPEVAEMVDAPLGIQTMPATKNYSAGAPVHTLLYVEDNPANQPILAHRSVIHRRDVLLRRPQGIQMRAKPKTDHD